MDNLKRDQAVSSGSWWWSGALQSKGERCRQAVEIGRRGGEEKEKTSTFGAPQSIASIHLTMPDHVSNYPKDCSSWIGEQLCAVAEGEAEMSLIDGKKYESRAQRNTLKHFFRPDWLLSPPTNGSRQIPSLLPLQR